MPYCRETAACFAAGRVCKMLRLGIIGSGSITDLMRKGLEQCDGWQAAVCYSRTREQAEINAEKWKAPQAENNWEAFCAADMDAVYVASPNVKHFEQTRDLLLNGKHVLLEKPACLNESELTELIRIAKEKQLVLMEAMRPMHVPYLDRILRAITAIGPVRYASLPYCQYSSRYDNFKKGIIENAFKPEMGGGALMDIGVYPVSWAEYLFGMPLELQAQTVFLPGSIDGVTTLNCRYEGMLVQISCSKVHQAYRPCVIEGEKGYIELSPFPLPREMRIVLRNGETTAEALPLPEADMCCEAADFIAMCNGEKDCGEYLTHSMNVCRMLDEARRQTGIDFTGEH